MNASLAPGIMKSLHDAGLIADGSDIDACPLSGGVSSDIWRLEGIDGPICLKRALTKLKVKDDWFAPITRNASEVAWLQTIAALLPENVPEVLHHDEEQGFFVMRFYDPKHYKNWKQELLAGRADIEFAEQVGRCMGIIHGRTISDADTAHTFANDGTFFDIRLEPYLLATAARHADVSARLVALADITAATKVALVHGDISPKNILSGPGGPMFIDAECAWFGDPAFDMAFCLNHLLLKCVHAPSACPGFKQSFVMLCHGYAAEIPSRHLGDIMQRTAHLLPGLMLARIDGKSPVEYITDSEHKDVVRRFAKKFLLSPVDHPLEVCAEWHRTTPSLPSSSL
jgi:tRNA A-37 threonylcarbamoyl transferase component Bud32